MSQNGPINELRGSFAEAAPTIVPITTVDGNQVWITKTVLRDAYMREFGIPQPAQPSPIELARIAEKVRQAAYTWAYSSGGMNLDSTGAKAVADDLASRLNPEEAFNAFKAAYQFLYSSSGANLDREQSRQVAGRLSRLESPVEFVKIFSDAFTYAYSSSGMNLDRAGALKHALNAVGLN